MPTRANKSPSISVREAIESSGGNKNSDSCGKPDSEPANEKNSSACICDNDEYSDDEWEIDKEELLHVEINGIFQVSVLGIAMEQGLIVLLHGWKVNRTFS